MTEPDIAAMRTAYRLVFEGEGRLSERLDAAAAAAGDNTPVAELVGFIRNLSERRLLYPRRRQGVVA